MVNDTSAPRRPDRYYTYITNTLMTFRIDPRLCTLNTLPSNLAVGLPTTLDSKNHYFSLLSIFVTDPNRRGVRLV